MSVVWILKKVKLWIWIHFEWKIFILNWYVEHLEQTTRIKIYYDILTRLTPQAESVLY